jgi:Fur family transcriptional regulator, ferric uptake regulator
LLQFKLQSNYGFNRKSKEAARQIFSEYLENTAHRKTPERFAIVDEIFSINGHFDVESLYLSMKAKNYSVSRATLYNTIDLLIDSKLIVKHQFGKNIAQYERAYNSEIHDHMIDIEKGTVAEFYDPRIREIIEDACQATQFKLIAPYALYLWCTKKNPRQRKVNFPAANIN